jgi:hypothetical protein
MQKHSKLRQTMITFQDNKQVLTVKTNKLTRYQINKNNSVKSSSRPRLQSILSRKQSLNWNRTLTPSLVKKMLWKSRLKRINIKCRVTKHNLAKTSMSHKVAEKNSEN